ncbi:unnamed protein product, partial [Hapterophycus canaliculatus]
LSSVTIIAAQDVPEVPTGVYGTQSGVGMAIISWEAPEDNNSTITMYEVIFSRTDLDEGGINATGSPAPTSVNVSNLITGSIYTFFVRAVNSVGSSDKSEGSDEV